MNVSETQIRIILDHPSHPGNIGGAARAMKNMGLHRLTLVSPKRFPHAGAGARASGAEDVLKNTVIADSLDDALKDCTLVFGTSARLRNATLSRK